MNVFFDKECIFVWVEFLLVKGLIAGFCIRILVMSGWGKKKRSSFGPRGRVLCLCGSSKSCMTTWNDLFQGGLDESKTVCDE